MRQERLLQKGNFSHSLQAGDESVENVLLASLVIAVTFQVGIEEEEVWRDDDAKVVLATLASDIQLLITISSLEQGMRENGSRLRTGGSTEDEAVSGSGARNSVNVEENLVHSFFQDLAQLLGASSLQALLIF
ncbi:hypothetical protein P7K49_004546 [Saguinus oedipus]|uniref:Uncharacterized protein n=1 Tax=Saguinus oedipus TaxID=9490 RepID=A0ABQ9W8A0_SAGOE|nr:hypothetical protein P7K49_004546 [Saguinus oedipus]